MTDRGRSSASPPSASRSSCRPWPFGQTDADTVSSLASRLARLDRQIGEPEKQAIVEVSRW